MQEPHFRIRIARYKGSDLLIGTSPDHKGINVAARSYDELTDNLRSVIRAMLEAEGHQVISVEVWPDIDRVEGKLDSVITMLSDIRVELAKKPSSASLWTMVATVVSLSVAIAFGTFVIADYASRDRTWPPSSAGVSQP